MIIKMYPSGLTIVPETGEEAIYIRDVLKLREPGDYIPLTYVETSGGPILEVWAPRTEDQ